MNDKLLLTLNKRFSRDNCNDQLGINDHALYDGSQNNRELKIPLR